MLFVVSPQDTFMEESARGRESGEEALVGEALPPLKTYRAWPGLRVMRCVDCCAGLASLWGLSVVLWWVIMAFVVANQHEVVKEPLVALLQGVSNCNW